MSKFGAMRSMAGRAGRSMYGAAGRAGGAAQRAGRSAYDAAGRAGAAVQNSAAYRGVADTASKTVFMNINWGTIATIVVLGFFYMVIASVGINTFAECKEMQDKPVQENLNKWLIATLAIAITIPFTLFVTKVAGSKKLASFTLLYAILGIIGSSATLNWVRKCESAKGDESKLVYSGLNLASFLCVLIISVILLRSKPKI